MMADELRDWLQHMGAKTAAIEPGSPWENGYRESFNGSLWDELPSGEISYTLKEARVMIEHWRYHYNTGRPQSALGYRPLALAVFYPGNKKDALATSQMAA
jgi:transposase InsO family protein